MGGISMGWARSPRARTEGKGGGHRRSHSLLFGEVRASLQILRLRELAVMSERIWRLWRLKCQKDLLLEILP